MSILVSLLLSQISWAQEAHFSSTMAPLQLTGVPLVADLQVENRDDTKVELPDLAAHPELVHFELQYEGRRERRYNTASESPPERRWLLHPGEARELRLEVPASGGMGPGPYRVTVSLHHTEPAMSLPSHHIDRQAPHPVTGDLSGINATPGTRHADVAWVHQDGDAHHLVLHHQPGDRRYELVLADVPGKVQPWLSQSRLDTLGERSIVWQTAPQRIQILRLRGQRTRGSVRSHDLPWPKVEIAGQPITDHTGTLRIPIWIPAPVGPGGELRLATFSPTSGPTTQRIAQLTVAPRQVLSTLDAAGAGLYILVREDAVDIYTAKDGPDLPLHQRPVWRSQKGATALRAVLGRYPEGDDHPGGTALLLAARWPQGVATQWMTLQGTSLQGPALTSDLGTVVQVVARGSDWPALVFQDGADARVLIGSQLQTLGPAGVLGATSDGGLVWRTLSHNGPVNDQPIVVEP